MKKSILFIAFLCFICLSAVAQQTLSPITWTAYGLTFKAPKGIAVEEDTEETFLLNNNKFYITVQALESDDITKEQIGSELDGLADDDGMETRSAHKNFELPQFYGTYMNGKCEEDKCCYCYLLTKAAGSAFFVSVVYSKGEEATVETILKSFKMEE